MAKTTIEWCEHTANPIKARDMRTGATGHYCEMISPGCTHCYASRYQLRRHMPTFDKASRDKVEVYIDRKVLQTVLRQRTATSIFWCDMTDVFGAWVTDKWLDEIFAVVALTPQHRHLFLTKRIDRAFKYFTGHAADGKHIAEAAAKMELPKGTKRPPYVWPLPQLKLGVSMENQEYADKRLPTLLVTPAGGRFVSIEPQIGPVTLKWAACSCASKEAAFEKTGRGHQPECAMSMRRGAGRKMLDQVIVGGESGPGSRPFNLQWPRSLARQCEELELPLFVKQLGSFPTMTPIGTNKFEESPTKIIRLKLSKRKGNDPAEWPDDELKIREPMRAASARGPVAVS